MAASHMVSRRLSKVGLLLACATLVLASPLRPRPVNPAAVAATMSSSRRGKYSSRFPLSTVRSPCAGLAAPSLMQSGTAETRGGIAISLVVNPDGDAPCCGGEKTASDTSVASCISIAKAAFLHRGDDGCDDLCGDTSDFFSSMDTVNTLQGVTILLGGIATAMWMLGALSYLFASDMGEGKKQPRRATYLTFSLWLASCLSVIACQSAELGFLYEGKTLEMAESINQAKCYDSSTEAGYDAIVNSVRSTRILLWAEMAVTALSLGIGAYSLNDVFGSKDAKAAPMMVEMVCAPGRHLHWCIDTCMHARFILGFAIGALESW